MNCCCVVRSGPDKYASSGWPNWLISLWTLYPSAQFHFAVQVTAPSMCKVWFELRKVGRKQTVVRWMPNEKKKTYTLMVDMIWSFSWSVLQSRSMPIFTVERKNNSFYLCVRWGFSHLDFVCSVCVEARFLIIFFKKILPSLIKITPLWKLIETISRQTFLNATLLTLTIHHFSYLILPSTLTLSKWGAW